MPRVRLLVGHYGFSVDIQFHRKEQDAIAEYSESRAGIQFFCLGGSEAGGEEPV
jgi:hypothetical protein